MSELNLYEILNVSKTATLDEIKKSYKILAKKWHPDKNLDNKEESEKMFKDIAYAYSILSNEEKRKMYDISGQTDNNNPFDKSFELFRQMVQEQIPDVEVDISVKLKDLYDGIIKTCSIDRYTPCISCNSTGSRTGENIDCITCSGQGTQLIQLNPMMFKEIMCETCEGSGCNPKIKKCKKCDGNKLFKEECEVEIEIPKGSHDRYSLIIEDEGNYIPETGSRTNVIVCVKQKEHKLFKRGVIIPEKGKVDYADLLYELNITFAESICGFYKEIEHLDNHKVPILSKESVRHGDTFVIIGEGMPKINSVDNDIVEFGDLFIKIIVQHPNTCNLSLNDKVKIGKILNLSITELPKDVVSSKLIPIDIYKLDAKIQNDTANIKNKYKNRKHKKQNVFVDLLNGLFQ
jgi:DnaJ-class molecular chaperone